MSFTRISLTVHPVGQTQQSENKGSCEVTLENTVAMADKWSLYRAKLHREEKEAIPADYLETNLGECGWLGKEIKLAITQQGTIEGS